MIKHSAIVLLISSYTFFCQNSQPSPELIIDDFLSHLDERGFSYALKHLVESKKQEFYAYYLSELRNDLEPRIEFDKLPISKRQAYNLKRVTSLGDTLVYDLHFDSDTIRGIRLVREGESYKINISHEQLYELGNESFKIALLKRLIRLSLPSGKYRSYALILVEKFIASCRADSIDDPVLKYYLGNYYLKYQLDFETAFNFLKPAYLDGIERALSPIESCLFWLSREKELISLYEIGMKRNDPEAYLGMGSILHRKFRNKETEDISSAVEYLKKAVNLGNIPAFIKLNNIYKSGTDADISSYELERWKKNLNISSYDFR